MTLQETLSKNETAAALRVHAVLKERAGDTEADAEISPCGLYRYTLTRTWDLTKPTVCFCGFNPSTADALKDDPTIRRMRGFAKDWGYGQLVVVNLYAWRTPYPEDLWKVRQLGHDVRGPLNAHILLVEAMLADTFVVAWGGNVDSSETVAWAAMFRKHDVRMQCLGTTSLGAPRHPLYVPAITTLRPWP